MGQSDLFADNAKTLGVDLAKVDAAFLSHGHYDHGGGLARFLEINDSAPVFLANDAFGEHYSGQDRYIGLDKTLQSETRLVFCKDAASPLDGLSFLPLDASPSSDTFDTRMLKKEGQTFLPDDFSHERYLLLEQGGKRILLGGCAHKGILQLLDALRPDIYIGGFHFMRVDVSAPHGRRLLEQAAYRMFASGTLFYTGHCTGEAQLAFLKERLGDRLQEMHTGSVIEI